MFINSDQALFKCAIDRDFPSAGTKTLIHEIAHEVLHQGEGAPSKRTIRELEAESVAYIVAKYFGLDGLASPNYIALYGATTELIMQHLARIRATASDIINALSQKEELVGLA